MDFSAHWQWVAAGGYAAAVAALLVGVTAQNRPGGNWRLGSRVSYGLAGTLGSLTTEYALSRGTFDGALLSVWGLIPIAFTILVWWRGYRQGTWMRRLAGRTGACYRGDERATPSFGVLPGNGVAVAHDDPLGRFDSGVEFDVQGHRVLGMQYRSHTSDRPGLNPRGKLNQAITMADSTYSLVQLRTPVVPAMMISPRPGTQNPFEDAKITRNRFGDVRPDGRLQPVEVTTEFTERFEVRAANPETARALLTPEVQRLFMDDPWCRVRTVVVDHGAVCTAESGQLTEFVALGNARHLARIAAAIPAEAWGQTPEGTRFAEVARSADTSSRRWYGGRQRLMSAINDRRIAANRPPLSPGSITARVVAGLGVAALCGTLATVAVQNSRTDNAVLAFILLALTGYVLLRWTFFPKRATERAR